MAQKNRARGKRQEFYLDDHELSVVENNMDRLKINNKSEYYRDMALKGKKILFEYDRKNLCGIVTEINKIGTNINQIAKVTNERRNIYHDDVLALKDEITKIRRIIDKEFNNMTRELKKAQDESFIEIFEENFKL